LGDYGKAAARISGSPEVIAARCGKTDGKARKGGTMKTVVVGVDGSPGSVAALRTAVGEAQLRGCSLKVVSAWHVPVGAYQSGWVTMPISTGDYEQIGNAMLEKSLAAIEAEKDGVPVTPLVREGQPAEVLVEEAEGAELLVVGSRGLGGFRGLLLGSVSQQCAHHAHCPVLIVPAERAEA
jgi:nucleotide-binding universal stress UspA family protein